MSHHQSKADRSSDAQQRRGGRPGGGALNYQRASTVKGGGGGGHGASASAALLPPTATSAGLQAAPPPSAKRSNAANGQPRGIPHSGFEPTDSTRAQHNSLSQHQPQQNTGTRHSKQPPPVNPSSMNGTTVPRSTKPGTPSGAFATEAAGNVMKPAVSGDLSWNTVHPQVTFQFGSIGPGFMPGTGIPIPVRTNSAPPNLDEQKQDQARYEAANAAAVKAMSGPTQQAAGSHMQPSSAAGGIPQGHLVHSPVQHPVQVQFAQANSHAQSQAAVSTPAHIHMQAQLVTTAQAQQQGIVQLPYSHQTLHPQQGPGQTLKFPQPMAPLPGQMMAPQLASLPGQLSAQQIAQLPHQLGPLPGGLANQLSSGLPAGQYGLTVPPYIPHRTNRAVKIVHPETHEELKFDSKFSKPDTHMDSGATTGVVGNGPSHVRTSLGYASGAHHQQNVYSLQQNGPYTRSSQPYYQAPATANPVVSTAVTGTTAPRPSFSEASQVQRVPIQSLNPSVTTTNTKPISSTSGPFTPEGVAEQNLTSSNQAGLMSDEASQVRVGEKNVKVAKQEESSTVPVTDVKQGSEPVQEAAAGVQASTEVKLEGSSSVSRKDPASLRDQNKEAQTDYLRPKDSNRMDSSGHGTSEVRQSSKNKKKKEVSKTDTSKSGEGHKMQDVDGKKQVDVKAVQLPKAVTAPTSESNVSGAMAPKRQEESELSSNGEKAPESAPPITKLDSESVSNIEPVATVKDSTTITADTQETVLDDESQTKAAAESSLDVSMGRLTLENLSPKDTAEKEELPNLEEPHKELYDDDKGDVVKESVNAPLLPVPVIEPVGDAIEGCMSELLDVASSGLEILENGLEVGDAGSSRSSTSASVELLTTHGASTEESAQPQLDVSTNAHQETCDVNVDLSSDKDSHTGDDSVSALPDVRQGSKKKKLKDALAKADAASNMGDLYNAYKPPEVKKVDDAKVVKAAAEASTESTKSSTMVEEKAMPKEVDHWEDAAELPSPKVSSTTTGSTAGRDVTASEGAEKYTRDFLLTFKDQNTDLPLDFDLRADIAELLQNPQAVVLQYAERDILRSSGRMLDRQLSGGLRRGNSSNNFEDDRWNRPLGPSYGSGHMEMGPPGGFRPGSSQGLIARMPSSIRPGISVPTFVPGLIPGKPLPSPMTPATPGMVRTNTADSDRWQRLPPPGQKGLIPSPQTPVPHIHKAEKRYEVSKVSDEEELKQRQMKGILNKLTPQNFDKLFEQVKDVKIQSVVTLTGVISQIFDKALLEPTFCEMYAKFCVQLAVGMPEFLENGVKVTFKRVLLNKCQEEFHHGEREENEANNPEEDVQQSQEEREEKRLTAKRRMLGNIRFIGELYKKSMLTEKIMHECIRKLIGSNANPEEEDVEALCKLMSTIGQMIDHQRTKDAIDSYFERMIVFSGNPKLSSRLRFMLKDVIDLRRNSWQERRKVEGPKKIDEVHRDAVQERQATVAQAGRMSRGSTIGTSAGRRLGAPMDFGMRGPASPVYSPSTPMGNVPALGSGRGVQIGIRGPYAQDVRMEDRLLLDSRTAPMPLSQRPVDEGPITLGPQGGLGRGVTMRGPSSGSGRSALADASGEGRRFGPGTMSAYGPAAAAGSREEVSHKGMMSERPVTPSERPLLDRPGTADRYISGSSARTSRSLERTLSDRSVSTSAASVAQSNRPSTAPAFAHLNEEQLKEKSQSALIEYFSARDQKEVVFCIEELRAPKFHATMVCNWIALSFEKKIIERDLLVKLLINLHPSLLKQEHILKGFQMVLELFEDLRMDTPKAPEYVAEMLVKIILADVISLDQAANLLKIEPIHEIGVGLDMMTMILGGLQQDAGEQVVLDKYNSSRIRFEDFMSSSDRHKRSIPEMLQKKNLQFLNQDVDTGKSFIRNVGEQLMDHLKENEPVAETSKWLETNLTPALKSDSAFLRMLMSSVLKHCIPNSSSTYEREESKELVKRLSQYGTLLQKFAPDKEKQWQYIIAMQLFAHERGHPVGLMTMLFDTLYKSDVISESAYFKWEDDVKDSTPGRDKALRDVYRWLEWLRTAHELT